MQWFLFEFENFSLLILIFHSYIKFCCNIFFVNIGLPIENSHFEEVAISRVRYIRTLVRTFIIIEHIHLIWKMRQISLLLFCFIISPSIPFCFDSLMYGYRLNNFITEEISNIGVQTCIKECLLRKPHCQSINYNTQQFRCEVNSKGADILLEGTPDVNSIFAYLANVSKVKSTCYFYAIYK